MQRIGETENVVGSIVALHRVPALAERKRAAEFADDLMAISHHPLGGQCDLMLPVAIDHPWAQFAASCARAAKIIRHIAESLEDHRVLELADVGAAAPRERNGAGVGFVAGQGFCSPDRGGSVRTFDRLARRQTAAFNRA
jgi:hypothetical protein